MSGAELDLASIVALRPIQADDTAFLYDVYASTRTEELAAVSWDDEQKAAFLRMQFMAQHRYYEVQYPNAAFDVVLIDGEGAGRLYVHRAAEELRIIDITILPAFRNRQVGTYLMTTLQAEAARARKPLRIHMERFNPALRLYERLGFRQLEDRGAYLFMEWRPSA